MKRRHRPVEPPQSQSPPSRRFPLLLTGGARQVAAQVGGAVLWLASMPLLTRHLGPSRFGEYVLVSTAVGLIALLADLGLPLFAQREIALASSRERPQLVRDIWRLRWVTAGIATLLSVAASAPAGALRVPFVVASLGIPALLVTYQSVAHLIALPNPARAAWIEIFARSAAFGAVMISLTSEADLTRVLALLTLGQTLAALVALRLSRRVIHGESSERAHGSVKLLRLALPLGAVPLLTVALNRSDTLVLAALRSTAEVGVYGVAYRGIEVVAGFAYVGSSLMLTLSARTANEHRRKIRDMGIGVLVGGSCIVAGILLGFTTELLQLAGGEAFLRPIDTSSGPLSPAWAVGFLLASLPLMTWRLVDSAVLLAAEDRRFVLTRMVGMIAVKLTLAALLASSYGLIGAAAAALLTDGGAVLLFSRRVKTGADGPRTSRAFRTGAAAGVVAAVIGMSMQSSSTASRLLAVGGAVVTMLWVTGWIRTLTRDVAALESSAGPALPGRGPDHE